MIGGMATVGSIGCLYRIFSGDDEVLDHSLQNTLAPVMLLLVQS